jgi:hypothetical protein
MKARRMRRASERPGAEHAMIFLHKAKLVILSQPKTGTTALELALAARASIVCNKPPELKHMSYGSFMRDVAPLIAAQAGLDRSDYEVVAVMREPEDWLGSWYRYRTRDELRRPDNPRAAKFTGHISFDQFVADVCRPEPEQPPHAAIRTPSWVALSGPDTLGVDRLFSYAALDGFFDYVGERTGKPFETRAANVSPKMDLSLLPERRQALTRHFAFDFELYGMLSDDGSIPERLRNREPVWSDGQDLKPGV